jgi:hypothetical protein
MFHIITPDGLTVAENGQKSIFVPKDHDEYEDIVANINTMSYWDVVNKVDTKCRLQSLIDDKTEAYFNENDDFEVAITGLDDGEKVALQSLVRVALTKIIEDRYEGQADLTAEKEKEIDKIEKLLKKLEVAKVKVSFE